MHWTESLIQLVLLLVGLPAALRFWPRPGLENPTAAALVVSWCFGQWVFLSTGDNLPIEEYMYADFAVVVVIFCKPATYPQSPYRNLGHQLACFWLERTTYDKTILALFLPTWIAYFAPVSETIQWWTLYWIVVTQLLLAGAEALQDFVARREANAADGRTSETRPPDVKFSAGLVGYG